MNVYRVDIRACSLEQIKSSKLYKALLLADNGRTSSLGRIYKALLGEGLCRIFSSSLYSVDGWVFDLTPYVNQYTCKVYYTNSRGELTDIECTCFAPSKVLAKMYAEAIGSRIGRLRSVDVRLCDK